jgi:hypothetical protein
MLIRLLKFWGKLQGPRPLDFQPVCIYANNVPLPKLWPVLKGSVELKNIFNCNTWHLVLLKILLNLTLTGC